MQTILVVDDEQLYLEGIADALKDRYHLLQATNGEMGLKVAKKTLA